MVGQSPPWRSLACLSVPSLVVVALGGTACQPGGPAHPPPLDDPGAASPPGTIPGDDQGRIDGEDEPGAPFGPSELAFLSVRPDHGPTAGGTDVVLRGAGFEGDLEVLFDGRRVDPVDVQIEDDHRLRVRTPPGEVGPADVEVRRGDEIAVLAGGFSYDSFYVEPSSGSTGGGTRVELRGTGTTFDAADIVTFGGTQAVDMEVVSEVFIRCTVPAGNEGEVDVRVSGPGGEQLLEDGFLYYNTADPFGGGLGGGPIDGTVDVTVLDWLTLEPVEGAVVLVGLAGSEVDGVTNANGQVTFASELLQGPQSVTASKTGYGSSSFFHFDARAVTLFLMPIPDPDPGGGGSRPERLAATIEGELIFFSEVEFGPGPWRIVPDPVTPDEVKVAYVFTSKPTIWSTDVDPGEGGVVTIDDAGENGYGYAITARPGGYAIWAIAGLFDNASQTFSPWAMGLARDVLGGPGETVTGVDIEMTIPLDHAIEVELEGAPARGQLGPDTFGVDAYIDLGGEGVIPRYDVLERAGTSQVTFVLPWMAPFDGNLSDASYLLLGGAWTGIDQGQPYSLVVDGGHRAIDDPITVGPFNCVPRFADPLYGSALGPERELHWTCDGQEPEFYYMELWQGTNPVWSMFVDGTERQVTLPDVADLTGQEEAAGDVTWFVYAITVPSATYDEVSYRHLRSSAWQRVAYDSSLFQL